MAKIRTKKFFLTVVDDRFEERVQSSIVSVLTDGSDVYLNQYGKMFVEDELGNFDIIKENDQAVLEFHPLDGRINDYRYSFMSYDIKQNIFNTGSSTFGNTVSVRTENNSISALASSSTIYSIPEDFLSGKLMIEISSDDKKHYEYTEINLVSVGNTSFFSNNATITISEDNEIQQSGIGTYDVVSTGSGKDIIFYPNINSSSICNTIGVSIANTSFTSTSRRGLRFGLVRSEIVNIAPSSSPISNVVSSFALNYNMSYYIAQVVDNTNGEIQISEMVIIHNNSDTTLIEYGNVYSNGPLGTFSSNLSSSAELLFIPNPDIDVTITVLEHSTSYAEFASFPVSINFKNAELNTAVSKLSYSGDASLKKDFDLTHNLLPIFESNFNGSLEYTDSNKVGVDLENDLIFMPNHFFRSGEKVNYFVDSLDFIPTLTTETTSISGVGTDIIEVVQTRGVNIGDYFGDNKIKVTEKSLNSVSLASTIPSQINSGVAVTFYGLFESEIQNNFSSIGIGTTYISGIGVTDKLGGDLYVHKVDDRFIGLCTSVADSISQPPVLINLTSLGSGSNHIISATNQNSKCLICVDNVIQSPIVSTGITANLENDLLLLDTTLAFSGIGSFFSGDLIRINDEIMIISSVGVGSTTFVEVQRSQMGTTLSEHSRNSLIRKFKGNYNIVRNKIHFSKAPYGPIFKETLLDINIKSTFQGRAFLRSVDPDSNQDVYANNYVFDDINSQFNAVTKSFDLKSNDQNITGFLNSNSIVLINNIFQSPENDYNLSEDASTTQVNFTGTATSAIYDVNNASIPRGGIIISVGSSNGFGYQPLVSAGGTAIVSISGTISSISIGNSGSGYRAGIQTNVRVGVRTSDTGTSNIDYIGIASIVSGNVVGVSITNPGFGYTSSNPPEVVFDSPLSYSNLTLINSTTSSGIGTEAKIDLVIGQESSVIDFTITNYGYSYKQGDILTVESGGISGIPTDTSKVFEPFSIIVERTYEDSFAGWSVGELQKLDDIDSLFTGFRRTFPLSDNGNRFAIIKKKGSDIELKSVLLVFLNDVLQEPDVAYNFNGGSQITFTEAPKVGSKCRILFYKGTPGIDIIEKDVLETLKIGDTLKIVGDGYEFIENNRLITDIILPDTAETTSYNSIGITSDLDLYRPVNWCKQRNDTVIDGISVNKDRLLYEPNIFPVSNLIQSVGIGSTQIFVDSIKTVFDAKNENTTTDFINKIEIVDNQLLSVAIATAIVSAAGTISSVDIIYSGSGYTSIPIVHIQGPVGIGSTGKASLESTISSGSVNSITISSPGYGYTFTNPPLVYIEEPILNKEYIKDVSYFGDFGIITGIETTSVGLASTALIFDLYIPQDSYLREFAVTTPIISSSQLQDNYYFKVSNSNVGNGVTSLRSDGSIIGIGTTGIDNIYQVISVSTATTSVYGDGSGTVAKVIVSVSDYNGLSGIGYSSYYGDYSWGLIVSPPINNSFNVNSDYGVVGLNSTPYVRRYNRLQIQNYSNV